MMGGTADVATMQDLFTLFLETSELVAVTRKQFVEATRRGDTNSRELAAIHGQLVSKRDNCAYAIAGEARVHPEAVDFLRKVAGDTAVPSDVLDDKAAGDDVVLFDAAVDEEKKIAPAASTATPTTTTTTITAKTEQNNENNPGLTEEQHKYVERLRLLKGEAAAKEEALRLRGSTPQPLQRVTTYSSLELSVIVKSISEQKIEIPQAKKFVIDALRQQQGKPSQEAAQVLSMLIMSVEKEQYDTEFDFRVYIIQRALEVFQGNDDMLVLVGKDTNCMLRLNNWLRYDLRARNMTNVATYLRFLSALKLLRSRLEGLKMMDVLQKVGSTRSELKEIALKLIGEAEQREKERPKAIKKKGPVPEAKVVPPPPKKFSIATYLQKRKVSGSDAVPSTNPSVPPPVEVKPSASISTSGLKPILKRDNSKRKNNKVCFKADNELVQIRYIPLALEHTKGFDETSMAREEGKSLLGKAPKPNQYGITIVDNDLNDWVEPRLVNFDLGADFVREKTTVTRGGTDPLALSDDTDKLKRPTGYDSNFSPFEELPMITDYKLYDYKDVDIGVPIHAKSLIPSSESAVVATKVPQLVTKNNVDVLDNTDDDLMSILADGDRLLAPTEENNDSDDESYEPSDDVPLSKRSREDPQPPVLSKRPRPNAGSPPNAPAALSRRSRSGELPPPPPALSSGNHLIPQRRGTIHNHGPEYPTHTHQDGQLRISRSQFDLRSQDVRARVRNHTPYDSSRYTEPCNFFRPNTPGGCRKGDSCIFLHQGR